MTKIVVASFPAKVVEKHAITMQKLATGKLTVSEVVRLSLISAGVSSAFFQFSQYNARARINEDSFAVLSFVASVGIGSFVLLGIFEWFLLSRNGRLMEEGGGG